jgi:hypothetical protein
LFIVLLITLIPGSALAGSITSGGITLHWPDYPLTGPALISCEPWYEPTANTISLTGIPDGSSMELRFAWSNPYVGGPNYQPLQHFANIVGGTLVVPVDYPMDSANWPVFDPVTNERAIAVAVFIQVTRPDGTVVKLNSKQWWVRCLPPPPPAQGCTPGYWRQDQHLDSWVPTGYAPGDDFNFVFGVSASFDPHTLLDAVWLGGGGEEALARHAVAALLNAAHPDVNYSYSVADVISMVQNAYVTGDFETIKDLFDAANNAGCSLD